MECVADPHENSCFWSEVPSKTKSYAVHGWQSYQNEVYGMLIVISFVVGKLGRYICRVKKIEDSDFT